MGLFMFTDNVACVENDYPLETLDIRIRDPFVYADDDSQTYYMYAQTGNREGKGNVGLGVEVYKSKDLKHWSNPKLVYKRDKDFWGGEQIWAPEMHRVGDWFYLFVSFNGREGGRGTQIIRAAKPDGPFTIVSTEACTPVKQCSLDGTLWIDDKGDRWMIYCHEWVQIGDGGMLAVRMKHDLSERNADPIVLFHASDAPWVKAVGKKKGNFVTDGPCLYKTKNGKLLMLWSSFTGDGGAYAIGVAESASGLVTGPWKQHEKPLYDKNGGHSMLFKTFEGQLMLAFHQPNSGAKERARFYKVIEQNDDLKFVD